MTAGLSPDLESTDEITFALDDGILRATLTRPDQGNAMTHDQRRRILAWLERANEDPGVRCVVLGATGRFFCTGADLRNGTPPPPRSEEFPEKLVGDGRRVMLRGAIALVSAIMDCEKPVIAAVNGTAAGLGVQLALACDFVVAATNARLIEVFVRRALVPDSGAAYLLPRLVGIHRAKELLMLGDDVSAEQAYEIGLITRVVQPDQLIEGYRVDDDTWKRLAEHLDERQLVELVFTVGTYTALAMAFKSFGLELDPDLQEIATASLPKFEE